MSDQLDMFAAEVTNRAPAAGPSVKRPERWDDVEIDPFYGTVLDVDALRGARALGAVKP